MAIDKLKKQIVFSDYDGTIYIPEQDMEKNIKLIEEYRMLGGKFIIVTGRSKTSVNSVIEKYNMQYDYIIANNGAIIFDITGNKIYEQTINVNVSSQIINYLKSKENIQIYYYDENDKVEYKNQELLKIRVRTPEIETAKNIEKEIDSVFGANVIAHAAFPSMYYDDIKDALIDIVSTKAGKENAIKQLLEILNIPSEQVVTIGDGRNDIAMIKQYNGFSMETAEAEVKEVATKIFKSVGDAIEYLKKGTGSFFS